MTVFLNILFVFIFLAFISYGTAMLLKTSGRKTEKITVRKDDKDQTGR